MLKQIHIFMFICFHLTNMDLSIFKFELTKRYVQKFKIMDVGLNFCNHTFPMNIGYHHARSTPTYKTYINTF